MHDTIKHLGLNCDVFEQFVTENRIYVDKTKIIYELITAPNRKHFYFVSRPRRFGKSLFISTLKPIFAGRKELFNEYWIGKHSDYSWLRHPVIHLDFGGIEHNTPEQLIENLCLELQRVAKHYDINTLKGTTPGALLKDLVDHLRTTEQVVLLIDEYDKPLVDHINNPVLMEANRQILTSFYTTAKSLSVYWRAIFVTGVSKFSRTSLFSGLNNLRELTFDSRAAELFGYTEIELVANFSSHIDEFAARLGKTREEILPVMKTWYDGYRNEPPHIQR